MDVVSCEEKGHERRKGFLVNIRDLYNTVGSQRAPRRYVLVGEQQYYMGDLPPRSRLIHYLEGFQQDREDFVDEGAYKEDYAFSTYPFYAF